MLTPGSLAIAACLAAMVWAPPALAQDPIVSLGTLGGPYSWAIAINDSGQIVGHSYTAANSDDMFLYTMANGMVDLGQLGGNLGPNGVATAINDVGQVVGYAWSKNGNGYHAFLYSNGVFKDLGTLGGENSYAYGINHNGQVVGYSDLAATVVNNVLIIDRHAFLYSGGVMKDLGTLGGGNSVATGIDSNGDIVGSSDTASSGTHAFLIPSGGVMSDLGTLGGTDSAADDINDSGQIVGTADTAGGASHAFLISGGPMSDLGTLGGANSEAVAINNAGKIVGYSDTAGGGTDAFLYSGGGMVDLNTLLPADSGWQLSAAYWINDYGQAVGYGQNAVSGWQGNPGPIYLSRAFRLDTEPPSVSNLSPSTATAGQAGFTLTVTGANFFPGAVVYWGATALVTTVMNTGELTATVPASLLTTAGPVNVTVQSAGTSAPATFTIYPPPSISSLSPNSAGQGASGFPLTINGANFLSGATAYWGTTQLATTVNNSGQLTATVPTILLATAGTFSVTVTVNGITSAGSPFNVIPPPPTITSLSPTTAAAAGAAFTLTINGANYVSGAKAYWNATALTTTFVNSGQITAAVPASLIASVGSASITVQTTGGTSGPATFTIKPQPTLTSVSPNTAVAGGAAFTLTVTGTNFLAGAKVMWNSTALTTTFVSSTSLKAAVPASLIATAGTASVTVTLLGSTSGAATFTITSPLAPITLSPSSATAGGPAFLMSVQGSNFHSGARVYWGTTALTTSFASASQLIASVPASLITTPGTVAVTVSLKGVSSAPATFTILYPPATITSLSPSSALHGGGNFTLTVNGAGFVSGAVVKWNIGALTTTFVSANKLTAAVPAAGISAAANISVTVVNPGAATSNALTFTVH